MEPQSDHAAHADDGSQGARQGPSRFLKTRSVLQALRSWRGRLLLYFASLAIVFAVIGLAQSTYVRFKAEQTVGRELANEAAEIASDIAYRDKWNLKGYYDSGVSVQNYCVVTQDGLLLDIQGHTLPEYGRFQLDLVDDSVYRLPQTAMSSTGVTWRLLGKIVDGGVVFVALSDPQDVAKGDVLLAASLAKFGTTLRDVTAARVRDINGDVHYAALGATGVLKIASGGVPLRLRPGDLPMFLGKKMTTEVSDDGRSYRLYSEPILDSSGEPVATITVQKDMTLQRQAVTDQDRFSIWLVIVALTLTVVGALAFTARELLSAHHTLTLEQALKAGESKRVEFKSAYQWDANAGRARDERRLAVLRAIVGFLNADGGNLYIGVEEAESGQARVCGLKEDLKLVGNNPDSMRLALANQVADHIGSQFSPYITDKFEAVGDEICWVIAVQRSPVPVFFRWRDRTFFSVREGPRTSDLDNERTYRYIKNRWG